MDKVEIGEALAGIEKRSREELWGPFPYDACRDAMRSAGEERADLIPDMDQWRTDIAGHCSWGRRWLKRNPEDWEEASNRLRMGFFERFPAYGIVRREQGRNRELAADIEAHERFRLELLELLTMLGNIGRQ